MPHSAAWSALAISSALLPTLDTGAGAWQVCSVRHACNLASPAGRIVALVSRSHGNGPFHIVVPDETLAAIGVADVAQLDHDWLSLPAGKLDLQRALRWSPRLPELGHDWLKRASSWLYELSASVASPLWPTPGQSLSTLQQQAAPAIAALGHGQATGHLSLIAEGANQLAGLGPGLTPAGDDLLVGWLAGLYLQGLPGAGALAVELIAATARPRTTRLSATWLYHARGEFSAPWHEWGMALNKGDPSQILAAGQEILRRGATSGHDAMLGFLLVCGVAIRVDCVGP